MRKKSNLTRIFEIDAAETFTTEVSAKIWTELATKIGYTPEMIAKTLPIATAGTLSAAEVAALHAKEKERASESEANDPIADDKEESDEEGHSSKTTTSAMKLVMVEEPEPPVIAAGLYFYDDNEDVPTDNLPPAKKMPSILDEDLSDLTDHPGLDNLIYDILYGDDDFDDFDDDDDFMPEIDSDAGLMGGMDTFFMRMDLIDETPEDEDSVSE